MVKRSVLLFVAAALLLGACGSSSGSNSSKSTTTGGASGGSSAAADGSCGGFSPGKGGVLQTFCDGTGSAKVTVDGKDHTVPVTCAPTAEGFTVNGGVVAGQGFDGTLPDYIGMILPAKAGAFSGASTLVSFQLGGKRGSMSGVTGTRTDKDGSFSGTVLTATGAGGKVSGTFTC